MDGTLIAFHNTIIIIIWKEAIITNLWVRFNHETSTNVDVGDLDDVGAYAFNGAINKKVAAATPTINIFRLFNLLNLSPFH
ncbi:MAG: hypothetical protein WBE34_20570 [Candidatus Nitrosopolaris sp.]